MNVKRIVRPLSWLAVASAATLLIAGCGGSRGGGNQAVTFKGTKKVAYSAPLMGQSALYGHAVSQSLKLAADDIDAKGGVNGYRIEMDIQDDSTQVAQAVTNTKAMILQDNVVALMGSVTSAQCLAESPIAKQNKIITIDATCNSWQLTTQPDIVNPYWVSIVPNTYMEGTAAGRLAAKLGVSKIFIVSPKYLFGISETNAFVAALKKANSSVQIVNSQSTWYVPFPTNPRWDSTINQIQALKPDLVYSNIFAADQINFINRYKALYNGEFPSDWAVMDYDALTIWAQAANAAKSFDADQVVKQISGHSFDSLRGYKITIRSGELQANVGETTGTTTTSSSYPFPILKDITNLKGDDLMMPLQMVNEIKGNQCDAKAGDPTTANFALCPSWTAAS